MSNKVTDDHVFINALKPQDFPRLYQMIKAGMDYPWFYRTAFLEKHPFFAALEYVIGTLVYNHGVKGTRMFALREPRKNQLIGCVVLTPSKKADAEIGAFLDPAYRSNGLISRALQLVIQKAQRNATLTSLCATVHPSNKKSQFIPLRLGFCLSGYEMSSSYKEKGRNVSAPRFIYELDDVQKALAHPVEPNIKIIDNAGKPSYVTRFLRCFLKNDSLR